MGHQVVMSPTTFVYLDYMQGDSVLEPPVYATLRLKTTYSFEPVPDSVDPKLILGGQGNLWTEQVYNMRHLEYMIWPRGLAIAECLWSPKEKRDWGSFSPRVESAMARMDEEQVKYARSMFDPIFNLKRQDSKDADSLQILLSTEVDSLHLYYSFDNSNPDNFYPEYSAPLTIPKEAVMLKVVSYRDGRPIGRQVNMPVAVLRRRWDALPRPAPKSCCQTLIIYIACSARPPALSPGCGVPSDPVYRAAPYPASSQRYAPIGKNLCGLLPLISGSRPAAGH